MQYETQEIHFDGRRMQPGNFRWGCPPVNILFLAPEFDESEIQAWLRAFEHGNANVNIISEGELDADQIQGAIVYYPPPGRLQHYSQLRVIFSLSAGVDGLLGDPSLPEVPLVRLMHPDVTALMREYVVYQVLRLTRRFGLLEGYRQERRWVWAPPGRPASDHRVLVLGLGQMGRASAEALGALGFQVFGWSRTPHDIPGIHCLHGLKGLHSVLPESDVVVCLLPLTASTRGLLDADFFGRLPKGARVLNAGRGGCVNDADMMRALETGQLSSVTLDVFSTEPLPSDHLFWLDPRINITPHAAAHPSPDVCVPEIIDCFERSIRGEALRGEIDREAGY